MTKYQELLIEWCDALIGAQITEKKFFGGFRCDSCDIVHGRADNAIYPLSCAYVLTGDKKYIFAVERLLVFRKKVSKLSGAVQNDFDSKWKGITAFSAIGLLKTLLFFGDKLPPELNKKIEKCAVSSARWVHRRMTIGFPANINYYCAASLVNALYYERYHDEKYRARAEELFTYCMGLFTENGLLSGEAKPHDGRSPAGCLPIDIGYIVEESMPCLIHTATILKDESALQKLTVYAQKQLDFFLPDGGWDNSFGVRNNKWTYYGSRTSDGCIGAFALLSKRDTLFAEAAERTYRLLKECTHQNKLYGGRRYYENGQKACIHHTFCHACALTDAILAGTWEGERRSLPCDKMSVGYTFYPELNTYKIEAGKYSATLTGYDYAAYTFVKGAAHAGGGTLSLLYNKSSGPVIAGSVYRYERTEKNNMQSPGGQRRHATLLLRAEYEKEGRKYATCLDRSPGMVVRQEGDFVTASVRSKFFCEDGKSEGLSAEFFYRFGPDGVTVSVNRLNKDIKFILPIVKDSAKVSTESSYKKEDIFFLTGGFAAEEYTFCLEENITVTIQ